jgi:hypothetical protein
MREPVGGGRGGDTISIASAAGTTQLIADVMGDAPAAET